MISFRAKNGAALTQGLHAVTQANGGSSLQLTHAGNGFEDGLSIRRDARALPACRNGFKRDQPQVQQGAKLETVRFDLIRRIPDYHQCCEFVRAQHGCLLGKRSDKGCDSAFTCRP
ncbi:hypothetical protein [Paraburkholderia terrae]|uniref:hypothetical protein n=1 Tax=Paraburkholderia terrae TaxID=311230 RepID=UPI002FDDE573